MSRYATLEMTTDSPQIDANDLVFAKEMADTLHAHYPGYLWAVTAEGAKGIATIRNLSLSGVWGFILRLPAIYSMSQFKRKVVLSGGEILERYALDRAAANTDRLFDLPQDVAGRIVGDFSK